jgi:hypothetical protein
MEHTTAPVIALDGPEGPVVLTVDLAVQGTVADLVRSVDAAARQSSAKSVPPLSSHPALLVRSAGVASRQAFGDGIQATIVVSLTAPDSRRGREITAEADQDRPARMLLSAVADTLAEFAEPRRALKSLTAERAAPQQSATTQVAHNAIPDGDDRAEQAEIEAVVGAIFDEILGAASTADPDADFFLRGGHSLLALAVLDAIEVRLGACVELSDFFDNATVEKAARLAISAGANARGIPQATQQPQIRGAGDPVVLLRLLDETSAQESDDNDC